MKKKTNQRNSPYNTTYVSEPPEKLQRTFMGDFEKRPTTWQTNDEIYGMAHTVYGTKQQLTFHHTDSLSVKEVHFDYGAASNGG